MSNKMISWEVAEGKGLPEGYKVTNEHFELACRELKNLFVVAAFNLGHQHDEILEVVTGAAYRCLHESYWGLHNGFEHNADADHRFVKMNVTTELMQALVCVPNFDRLVKWMTKVAGAKVEMEVLKD